jgi:hypothetical protein
MKTEITPDKVIEAYVATRDEIAALEEAHKAEIRKLQSIQERREAWLHQFLNDSGQESAKTVSGTAFKKRKEFVSMGDWDQFLQFVQQHQAWELLNRAVNKTAALALMGEERDLSKVPGVKYSTAIEVQINRPR